MVLSKYSFFMSKTKHGKIPLRFVGFANYRRRFLTLCTIPPMGVIYGYEFPAAIGKSCVALVSYSTHDGGRPLGPLLYHFGGWRGRWTVK